MTCDPLFRLLRTAALFALCSCAKKQEPAADAISLPLCLPAAGFAVPAGNTEPPTRIQPDERSIKRLRAGVPEKKPVNRQVHPAGIPVTVAAGAPLVLVPGKDNIRLSQAIGATGKIVSLKQTEPVAGLPFRIKDAAAFNIQCLDVDQGLSSSYISAILADRRGNLWFGTEGSGLSRYNGSAFTHYGPEQGVPGTVKAMLQDRSGNLWFATWEGLCRYDGKALTLYTDKDGLGSSKLRTLYEDRAGNLWIGTDGGGVCRYDGRRFTRYTTAEGLSNNRVRTIVQDRAGRLWFGTYGGGLCSYDGSSFSHYTEQQGLCSNYILCALEDRAGRLWFGTQGQGLVCYDGSSFAQYTEKQGLGGNDVRALHQDRLGNLWMGTYGGGLCKYDGLAFTHYTEQEGLSSDYILAISEDAVGNLWLGTLSGACRYDWRSFAHYTGKEGLRNPYSLSLLEDRAGNLWLGTLNGLSKYDGKSLLHYTVQDGLDSPCIWSLLEDRAGKLWLGTNGGGAVRFDGKSFTYYTVGNGMPDATVIAMAEDRQGNLWFGTYGGVARYDGRFFVQYTRKQGLCGDSVRAICEDRQGNLWFGSLGGLSRYDGTAFTQYRAATGLSNSSVRSLCVDRAGNLWVGTESGLNKYDGKTFTHYTTAQGLSHNKIWSIAEDRAGRLWVGTEKGLNCLMADPHNPAGYWIESFHKEDGLRAEDFLQNAVLADSRNRMWWGSGKALSMLDLGRFEPDAGEPQARLESVSPEERFVDFGNAAEVPAALSYSATAAFYNYPEGLQLPHDLDHLSFRFSATDWRKPHKLLYQYRLKGLETEWSQPSAATAADYRNIPPGTYTLALRAISPLGRPGKPFSYPFTIQAPWWRSMWAECLYALLTAAAVYGIVWLNSRKLKARAKALQLRIEEATGEIRRQKQLIEGKHREITDSINYAERIQRSFLASRELLDENLPRYFIYFRPRDVVSGDFYWACKLDRGRFALVAADSTGHGVPGAIMSLLNITSLEKAVESRNEPAEILNVTRRVIIERLRKDGSPGGGQDGMDVSLIVLNPEKTCLSYAAANNPVWIVRGDALIELKPDKMPVGRHDKDHLSFSQNEVGLQEGDMIYLITDGMPDQFGGAKGKKYKGTRLKEFLLSIASFDPVEQERKLKEEFEAWKGEQEQLDDVTVIGIRISRRD